MVIPAELLVAFPPSAELLLDRARRHIDDAMLMEIAGADYGWMADEMMAELRPIRDTGAIPAPMPWKLSEVLALTQFSNPDAPNAPPFEPGPTGRRGHQTRLFACAVLLRAEAELPDEVVDATPDSTLAQCLVSANVLGEEMSEAAARFLTWRISSQESGAESLLFALGLLILAIRLRSGRIAEPAIGTFVDWILEEEARNRPAHPSDPTNPMPVAFSLQSGFWRPLATELLHQAAAIRADDVRAKLQLCELLLEVR
jgi:hypothetical protein